MTLQIVCMLLTIQDDAVMLKRKGSIISKETEFQSECSYLKTGTMFFLLLRISKF